VLFIGLEESHGGFGLPRFVAAGLPAAGLVIAALLLERVYFVRAQAKAVFLAGESSYILYLIHPYVIYGVLRTLPTRHHDLSGPATAAVIVALLSMSTAAAIAVHVWFEKPVTAWLRRILLAAPPRPSGAPAHRGWRERGEIVEV